jgi:hypothetical protein
LVPAAVVEAAALEPEDVESERAEVLEAVVDEEPVTASLLPQAAAAPARPVAPSSIKARRRLENRSRPRSCVATKLSS